MTRIKTEYFNLEKKSQMGVVTWVLSLFNYLFGQRRRDVREVACQTTKEAAPAYFDDCDWDDELPRLDDLPHWDWEEDQPSSCIPVYEQSTDLPVSVIIIPEDNRLCHGLGQIYDRRREEEARIGRSMCLETLKGPALEQCTRPLREIRT